MGKSTINGRFQSFSIHLVSENGPHSPPQFGHFRMETDHRFRQETQRASDKAAQPQRASPLGRPKIPRRSRTWWISRVCCKHLSSISSQEIRENTVSTHLHWLKCLVFVSSIGATNNKANPCEFPKGKLPS